MTVANDAQTESLVANEDYIELSRLVIEHAFRMDQGHADTLHELWTEEGELELQSTVLRGRDAIAAWGRQLVTDRPWQLVRHVCGNMRFVSIGPDVAEGVTILTVFMVLEGATPTSVPFNVGEDHDRFVRTDDGWRFASRRWVELLSRGDARLTLPK